MSLRSEIGEAARVYQRVPIGNILTLWQRRLRLAATRLLSTPAPALAKSRPRVVVSLTTIPSRIGRIRGVLNSLVDQTAPADEILLAVPRFSQREQCAYRVPKFLAETSAVRLLPCEDWGPATKLIPALEHEREPRTLILAVDDDTIYPPDMIANLLAWHACYPDAALGLRGWSLPASLDWHATRTRYGTELDEPLAVDVLTGTWGILVQPRFFDDRVRDYSAAPREAFFVDDVWFNGHLARSRTPRLVIPCRRPPMSSRLTRINGLFFHSNRDGHNNNVVIQAFAADWQADNQRQNPLRQPVLPSAGRKGLAA